MLDEKALSTRQPLSFAEMDKIAAAFVASKMFGKDLDARSKAIVKIMAGQELGLAPFASMRAVHVIDGHATLSANTMAGMVRSSGHYDYTVTEKTGNKCSIEFFAVRDGKRIKLGTETFDMMEAKTAGLVGKQNWQKYPKAMLFARCMSNGVRTYCPDVFSGMTVYTPDELEPMTAKAPPVDAEIVEDATPADNAPDDDIAAPTPDEIEKAMNEAPTGETES